MAFQYRIDNDWPVDLAVPHFQMYQQVRFHLSSGVIQDICFCFLLGNMSHDVMVQPIHHNGQHGG